MFSRSRPFLRARACGPPTCAQRNAASSRAAHGAPRHHPLRAACTGPAARPAASDRSGQSTPVPCSSARRRRRHPTPRAPRGRARRAHHLIARARAPPAARPSVEPQQELDTAVHDQLRAHGRRADAHSLAAARRCDRRRGAIKQRTKRLQLRALGQQRALLLAALQWRVLARALASFASHATAPVADVLRCGALIQRSPARFDH